MAGIAEVNVSKLNKIRGFVLDERAGHPISGAVVVVNVVPDDGVPEIPISLLATDGCGFVSFDVSGLAWKSLKSLSISVVGSDAHVDIAKRRMYQAGKMGPDFILRVDGRRFPSSQRLPIPAIANADAEDRRISPGSFAVRPIAFMGESGCEIPLPSTEPERDIRVRRVVRTLEQDGAPVPADLSLDGIDPQHPSYNNYPLSRRILFGEVLDYRQTWCPLGHSIGELLYSLPLAPCESVNVAVLDWVRQDLQVRQDDVRSRELLLHELRRNRTVDETLRAALEESQTGWSLAGGIGQASSTQSTSSGQGSVSIPIEGIPIELGGAVSRATGFAQAVTVGGSIGSTAGSRDVDAESRQELRDLTRQATMAFRSLISTVVFQASQQEQSTVQTRTVVNHNHCHALTMQYYEVLRHFEVRTRLVARRRAILVPYQMKRFDWELALHFRSLLEPLVETRLRPCFDAVVRLRLCPDLYSIPKERDEDGVPAVEPPPQRIVSFDVSLAATSWNFGTTWGEIWVDVFVNSLGDWRTIWHKNPFNRGELEFNKLKFPQQVGGQGINPLDIDGVQVRWQEDNGNDSFDLSSLIITYRIEGKPGSHTLINAVPLDVPSGSKSGLPALVFFDDSGAEPITSQRLDTQPPPAQQPSDASAVIGKHSRIKDQCCEQRLLRHLNGNRGFYNRAIWLLQDSSERQIQLDQALGENFRPLLAGLDPTPLAVSGSHVAFAYTPIDGGENGDDVEDEEAREDIYHVSLPTRGLFAEAELGHCNSCEKRDVTRFWRWEESPCPQTAPRIENIQPGPQGQPPSPVAPASLPSSVVQIATPPVAPDPIGLAAAFTLLGTPNIFRDMSGRAELMTLLNGLAAGTLGLADARTLAEALNRRLTSSGSAGRAGSDQGGVAGPQSAPEIHDRVQVAKEVDSLPLDKEQKQKIIKDIVTGSRPDSSQAASPADAGSGLLSTVEIKLRVFIPSPMILLEVPVLGIDVAAFAGDDRNFAYSGGSSRVEIMLQATVDPSHNVFIASPSQMFGISEQYDTDDVAQVAGKPDWWGVPKAGAVPLKQGRILPNSDNLTVEGFTLQKGRQVRIILRVDGSLPFKPPGSPFEAPTISGRIVIDLQQSPGAPAMYRVEGQHDGFPAWELYVNRQRVYEYDPVARNQTPLSLFSIPGEGAGEWSMSAELSAFRPVPEPPP